MNPDTIQFIVTYMMVLLTLACAYLGLRLVKQDWKLRLALIIVPLLATGVFSAVYRPTHFVYLGVILLLCIPFVWPRKSV